MGLVGRRQKEHWPLYFVTSGSLGREDGLVFYFHMKML